MQNHFHTNIERTSEFYSDWIGAEIIQPIKKQLCRITLLNVKEKAKAATSYILTILAVSGLFLGGTYLFLSQLSEYGW